MKRFTIAVMIILISVLPVFAGNISPPSKWQKNGSVVYPKNGMAALSPEYAYNATNGETVPLFVMLGGVIVNTGATGTEEYTFQTPTVRCDFLVYAEVAQTIEVDFPAGVNAYLNDVQIGADNEIDVAAGSKLRVTYSPVTSEWRCYMSWGPSTDGGADD